LICKFLNAWQDHAIAESEDMGVSFHFNLDTLLAAHPLLAVHLAIAMAKESLVSSLTLLPAANIFDIV